MKMNKQRITNLIGAGTMVALVVAIGLLLGGNRPNVSADSGCTHGANRHITS